MTDVPVDRSLSCSYRRPSFVASWRPVGLLSTSPVSRDCLASAEVNDLNNEERLLLKATKDSSLQSNYGAVSTSLDDAHPEPFANDQSNENESATADLDLTNEWNEAVKNHAITSTYSHETKVLVTYSAPLAITFLLQCSEQFSSVFSLGHLGTVELGAASLSTMLAAITGLSVFQGFVNYRATTTAANLCQV